MSNILNLHYAPDGTVTNKTGNDPSVPRVKGYESFWVGVDLGQANDYTAIVIVRDRQLPERINNLVQLGERERTIVFADKFRGESYVAVVDYLARLANAQPFAGRAKLLIDGTSLGRVVSDQLFEQNIPHTPITMTAGQKWSQSGRYVNAGKTLIIESGAVLFSSGELKFAHDLQMREEIEQDLATFTLTTTNAGNQVISQARTSAGHGDSGIALLLCCFASTYLTPGFTGQAKIGGYY